MVDISKVARVCVCATPTELDRDTHQLTDRYLNSAGAVSINSNIEFIEIRKH